ncbi:MAG: hypothetical protein VYA69_08820 [Gemmatimonadota bacterium]|nr:hypothetical protein [Gemmatimonadota bacterium]
MFYQKYEVQLLFITLSQLLVLSCYDADRANPLDGTAFSLFIPNISKPIGGEEMFPGIPQEIRWRPAARVLDSSVAIHLICEGDTTVIIESTSNDGVYEWDVPDSPSRSCRIRIVGMGGSSQSPGAFRIRKRPVEAQIDIGGIEAVLDDGPHRPTALREKIIFTATQGGNTDIWLLDRSETPSFPSRLTSNPYYDGEAAWLKPNGTVITYTSEDSTGQQDVWIRATEGMFGPQTTRVTQNGGTEPAWRNMLESDSYSNPALIYKLTDNQGLSRLITADLDFNMASLPMFTLPIRFTNPQVSLPLHTGPVFLEAPIDNAYWFSDGSDNFVIYGGYDPTRLYEVSFFQEKYDFATNTSFGVRPGLVPSHPSISPDGQFVAFSSQDDIWLSPIGGVVAWRVTLGNTIDGYPDWATNNEIVFQRKNTGGAKWQLWAVQRPDDVP